MSEDQKLECETTIKKIFQIDFNALPPLETPIQVSRVNTQYVIPIPKDESDAVLCITVTDGEELKGICLLADHKHFSEYDERFDTATKQNFQKYLADSKNWYEMLLFFCEHATADTYSLEPPFTDLLGSDHTFIASKMMQVVQKICNQKKAHCFGTYSLGTEKTLGSIYTPPPSPDLASLDTAFCSLPLHSISKTSNGTHDFIKMIMHERKSRRRDEGGSDEKDRRRD